jgi:hypothetical protein
MFLISLIFLFIVLFGNNLDINKVPKIVYLCYKTKDVPSSVIKSWKNLNPDYKIKLYDNQEDIYRTINTQCIIMLLVGIINYKLLSTKQDYQIIIKGARGEELGYKS